MKFDELDQQMRIFETAADYCVLPGIYMVARLDGRSFTRLTKEGGKFDVPFDTRFRDLMVSTTRSLMDCGFQVLYAYTESDEISLLFDPQEKAFGRKTRKFNSILAAQASAHFTLTFGQTVCFDCRISQLPTPQLVVDYFRWRNEDAARNALNAWCYWTLREAGHTARQATRKLLGLTKSQKNELLFQFKINFNDLPSWQKRGVGLSWETYKKIATNPITNEEVEVLRKRVRCDFELPMKQHYSDYIRSIVVSN